METVKLNFLQME